MFSVCWPRTQIVAERHDTDKTNRVIIRLKYGAYFVGFETIGGNDEYIGVHGFAIGHKETDNHLERMTNLDMAIDWLYRAEQSYFLELGEG